MELSNENIVKVIVAAIVGGAAWIWARINGDIRANKKAIEMLAGVSVSKEELIRYMDQMEQQRIENRENTKALFDKIDEHVRRDEITNRDISSSLARLEERSKKGRSHD